LAQQQAVNDTNQTLVSKFVTQCICAIFQSSALLPGCCCSRGAAATWTSQALQRQPATLLLQFDLQQLL
jgi:hypothetical protein